MGISTTIIFGAGWLFTTALPASPAAIDTSAVQTYRFGDWVMTVAPQGVAPSITADAPSHDMVILPASFVQDPTTSPPLPLDEVTVPPVVTEPTPCTSPLTPAVAHAGRYAEIYASIPFSRTEYDVNPSYRHDATMELLLGQPRPRAPIQQTSVQVEVDQGGVWPLYRTPYGYGWPRFRSNFYPSGITGTRLFVSE